MNFINAKYLAAFLLITFISCNSKETEPIPEPYLNLPKLTKVKSSAEIDKEWAAFKLPTGTNMLAHVRYLMSDRYRLDDGTYIMDGLLLLKDEFAGMKSRIILTDQEADRHFNMYLQSGPDGEMLYKVIPGKVLYMSFMDILRPEVPSDSTDSYFNQHLNEGTKEISKSDIPSSLQEIL